MKDRTTEERQERRVSEADGAGVVARFRTICAAGLRLAPKLRVPACHCICSRMRRASFSMAPRNRSRLSNPPNVGRVQSTGLALALCSTNFSLWNRKEFLAGTISCWSPAASHMAREGNCAGPLPETSAPFQNTQKSHREPIFERAISVWDLCGARALLNTGITPSWLD